MLFDWFKDERPNIYLGSLALTSDDKLSRIENIFNFSDTYLHDHIREQLEEIFCLDHISTAKNVRESDLVLDVVIVSLRGGDAFTVNWGNEGLPFFWRPKIKLVSRLYNYKKNKTVRTFRVSQTVSWREYFIKLFSIRGFFRFGPLYAPKDMELLLVKACITLVGKMRKVVYT